MRVRCCLPRTKGDVMQFPKEKKRKKKFKIEIKFSVSTTIVQSVRSEMQNWFWTWKNLLLIFWLKKKIVGE